ncbi:Bsp6I family type II restriction endonuclease [Mycoplasma yeatsii]|uniref:Type II restriction endonuclease n=1 Tax=Mycoplasma yeatsii TaxID=51365 RepID=A0ABU0NDG8_9MOLU|nr:Bsp6I family type II restriction endonuclease [Mycoplasma yeatsii]MDQ0567493.1 hypothetical protein [Mycoplasma yeatsii]
MLKTITKEKYDEIISLYPLWKELNKKIKISYTRGVNFHEIFSEFIVCHINDYQISHNEGSEDAISKEGLKIQIKSSSNYNTDLTSFGPRSEFDILEFARLNQQNDLLYLYKIPIQNLKNIEVKQGQTFAQQQEEKRRPRFSIISKIIEKENLKPYAKVNMITGEYEFYNKND